ncbi:NUDIX hydrolase [Streptomyces sp. NBC_01476]|uniref:NUDIX hydrolase n=1 Tax=Streptomyces sp. NBC_01476 TaxID=2903881 RepID=UPI002E322BD6|nr:NUDIX hydrolase [Streptomyces sp. NBC_01476]
MAYTTTRLPISVKGIVFEDGKVWLRLNERGEWELPGGKLDPGEQPSATVEREMAEELGMRVRPVTPVHAYRHTIPGSADEADGVLVLSYLCDVLSTTGRFELRGEGGEARFDRFSPKELVDLPMPDFYREAITAARGVGAPYVRPGGNDAGSSA